MDDESAGAGHQGALPCRGGLRQDHERRLAAMRLPEILVADGSGDRTALWLAKAHDSVEGAREHMGLQLRKASKLNAGGSVSTMGRPRRVGCANSKPRLPSNGPNLSGKVDPGACEVSAASTLIERAGRPEAQGP